MSRVALVALGAATLVLAAHAGAAESATCSWSPNPFTSVGEGDAGTASASLDLVCANPTSETFTVAFSTVDGWAVAPADFVAAAGELSVPPGDSTARISVEVVGDLRPEATEPLGITLSEASGQLGLPPTALVNIVDDDGFAVTSVSRSAPEGDGGGTSVEVEVRLSDALEHAFDVNLFTEAGTATAGSDYEHTNQTKTFAAGELSKLFTVTVLGDTADEPDETVLLGIATPGVQTLTAGLLTIVDDDDEPPAPLRAGDVLVVDPEVPPLSSALLFRVDPATGARTVAADFGAGDPTAVAVEGNGAVLVTDTAAGSDPTGGTGVWGALWRLAPDPGTGALTRTVVTDFGVGASTGRSPLAVAVEADGQILVLNGNGGTGDGALLVRVDPTTGARAVVSDFGSDAQGVLGVEPRGVAVEADGRVVVVDAEGGTSGLGALVRVDPGTGARALLSDFGSGAEPGSNPVAVAVEANGGILVADEGDPSTSPLGLLFRVDPQTGDRTVLSDFNTGANTGLEPAGVALEADGRILVVDKDAGPLNRGLLFRVDPQSGTRSIVSDFETGANAGDPLAVAVVPPRRGRLDVVTEVVNDDGGTAAASAWTVAVTGANPTPASFPGAGPPGTTVTLEPGAYTVSAVGPAGYTTTFSAGCAGTIAAGEANSCTITHDDRPATLVVVNQVVNDDAGTASASDWTMTVTGTNPLPASFPGAGAPGTTVTLDAGAYSVSRSGPAGYDSTASADCAGTIALGESKTCTVVNDDRFAAVISVAASPALDFGQVAIGASASVTGSLVVGANVPYTISVSRSAFGGGDIPLGASVLHPTTGRTATVAVPVGGGAAVGTGTASETPHDWRPIYTLGPVPPRSAGTASATVTYTVVAQ